MNSTGPNRLTPMSAEQLSIREAAERWYALRVKTRWERPIAMVIRRKGYEEFVPVYRCIRRWSDRTKVLDLPLFPGYVFCRLNPTFRLPLLTIPGVLHFVGIHNNPVAINDSEMAAIQIATKSGLPTEPWPYTEPGRVVRIKTGPLARCEGSIVESRDQYRFIVSMSLLRRSVSVEINKAWVVSNSDIEETIASSSPLSSVPKPDPIGSCER